MDYCHAFGNKYWPITTPQGRIHCFRSPTTYLKINVYKKKISINRFGFTWTINVQLVVMTDWLMTLMSARFGHPFNWRSDDKMNMFNGNPEDRCINISFCDKKRLHVLAWTLFKVELTAAAFLPKPCLSKSS